MEKVKKNICLFLVMVLTMGIITPTAVNIQAEEPINTICSTDIDAINTIITENQLDATLMQDNEIPEDWGFVQFSVDDTTNMLRVTGLNLINKALTGVLNISNMDALETLDVRHNSINGLTMYNNNNLTTLRADNNEITDINLLNAENLTHFSIDSNRLTNLNVASNAALKVVRVSNNLLSDIDVRFNLALESLTIAHNDLTSIHVASSSALQALNVTANRIYSPADVIGWEYIGLVMGQSFQFAPQLQDRVNITNRINDPNFLEVIRETVNAPTGAIFDTHVIWVTSMVAENRLIEDITGINYFSSLEYLDVRNNELTGLDISSNTSLNRLIVYLNNMQEADDVIGWEYHFYTPLSIIEDDIDWNTDENLFIFYPQREFETDDAPAPPPLQPVIPDPPIRETAPPPTINQSQRPARPTAPPAAGQNRPNVRPTEPIATAPRGPIPETINPLAPAAVLGHVTDRVSAVAAVENAITAFRNLGLDAPNATNIAMQNVFLSLFAESAIAQVASVAVEPGAPIVLDLTNVAQLGELAHDARNAIIEMMDDNNHSSNRHIATRVAFISEDENIEIQINADLTHANIDEITISTPYYDLTFSMDFVISNTYEEPITINATTEAVQPQEGIVLLSNAPNQREHTVTFCRPVQDLVRLSVPALANVSDTSFQTLKASNGDIIGGRHNPITGLLDARINRSDTYVVIENQVDFSDIISYSEEMQRSIRVLASQGIVNGTGNNQFSPSDTIDRASAATIFVRTLRRLNPNADGGFDDVNPTDWFFGSVGSAAQIGLMQGTGDNRFNPHLVIPRDQLTALSARVLREDMRYNNPTNPMDYLWIYNDIEYFADWSLTDIALATRENLVMRRADGLFLPETPVTRGEMAVMLYRVYLRIW